MAGLAFRAFIKLLKNLFESFNMPFGLFQMLFKSVFQFLRRSRFCHFGQRFEQLIFRAVKIA
jgi:hypothetical protein